MCPNGHDSQDAECPSGKPCRFFKTYIDERGWKYRVMSGISGSTFKGRYLKPGKSSWHCMRVLSWQNNFDEAQADLSAYAKKMGWEEA